MSQSMSSGVNRSFAKGEYLFKQNELSQDLLIIKSGNVRIFKTEGTTDVELDTMGPGMVVGEVASIDGGVRSASGIATEDTEAIVIPSSEFKAMFNKIPEYVKKISLILAQRLREVDSKINRSIDGDRTNHVAAIISLMAQSSKCTKTDSGVLFNQKFLENEITDLLNLPLIEVSDTLEQLNKKGILKLDKGNVVVPNLEIVNSLAQAVFQTADVIPAT